MKQEHATDAYLSNEEHAFLTKFLKQLGNTDPVPPEEEVELAQRIHNGDENARHRLANANVRYMVRTAKQYQHLGLPFEDLVMEGYIGLLKAVDHFDETKGYKFLSYAIWWIRESILQALANTGHTIRLPMNQVALLGKINNTIREFELEHGRTPSEKEIADILDIVDEKKISTVLNASGKGLSLDNPFSEDDNRTIADTVDVADDVDPDKKMMNESLRSELMSILSTLPPNEQYILGHFYGVGYDKMSLDEIAEKLKRPRERVQVVKEKGFRHIKAKPMSKALKKFLEIK